MTLPRVGYYGKDLGNALGTMGKALGDINDPDQDLRKKLRELLLANPKLQQELANMEALNPGSVTAQLGADPKWWGGSDKTKLAGSITGMKPDELTRSTLDLRELEGKMSPEALAKIKAALNATGEMTTGVKGQGDALKDDVQGRIQAMRQSISAGKPYNEADYKAQNMKLKKMDLENKGLEAGLSKSKQDLEKGEQDIELDKFKLWDVKKRQEREIKLKPIIDTLPSRNIENDVKAVLKGTQKDDKGNDYNAVAEAYMHVPEYSKLFQDAHNIARQDRMFANQAERAQFGLDHTDDIELRKALGEAVTKLQQEKGANEKELEALKKDPLNILITLAKTPEDIAKLAPEQQKTYRQLQFLQANNANLDEKIRGAQDRYDWMVRQRLKKAGYKNAESVIINPATRRRINMLESNPSSLPQFIQSIGKEGGPTKEEADLIIHSAKLDDKAKETSKKEGPKPKLISRPSPTKGSVSTSSSVSTPVKKSSGDARDYRSVDSLYQIYEAAKKAGADASIVKNLYKNYKDKYDSYNWAAKGLGQDLKPE